MENRRKTESVGMFIACANPGFLAESSFILLATLIEKATLVESGF